VVNGVVTLPLAGPQPNALRRSSAPEFDGAVAAEFVVGPENRLAAAAAEAFFQGRSQHFSPLVIYGPSGSGKSHLAQGLARWWRAALPSASVLVTCGSELARDYAAALDRQQLGEWRAALRSHDLLVVEDLGQLTGKSSAQQELLHLLDDLAGSEAMVVVTTRGLPQQISTLLAGLRSRLSAGLAVPLVLPGPDARRTILERLAAARGLSLPKGILQSLSGGPSVPVPALRGAILQLELAQRSGALDAGGLRRLLAEQPCSGGISLRDITVATARHFGLKMADLKSPSRRQTVVAARGIAIYLARLLTPHSLEKVGAYFGGRDHTTVLHGQRRTEKLMKRDPATRHAVAEVRKTLVI
jgi:chromosomal replication initiator protein